MEYKKIAELVQKLHEKTLANKVNWERTEGSNALQVSFTAYSVRLVLQRGSGGEDIYVIRIFDAAGNLVESATDDDLDEELPDSYTMMEEMFETARRKALGVDKALDDIISQLDEDLPF